MRKQNSPLPKKRKNVSGNTSDEHLKAVQGAALAFRNEYDQHTVTSRGISRDADELATTTITGLKTEMKKNDFSASKFFELIVEASNTVSKVRANENKQLEGLSATTHTIIDHRRADFMMAIELYGALLKKFHEIKIDELKIEDDRHKIKIDEAEREAKTKQKMIEDEANFKRQNLEDAAKLKRQNLEDAAKLKRQNLENAANFKLRMEEEQAKLKEKLDTAAAIEQQKKKEAKAKLDKIMNEETERHKERVNKIENDNAQKELELEQMRMKKEIERLEKQTSIENRDLNEQFNIQVKLYEIQLSDARKEIQTNIDKKKYTINYNPPAIVTEGDKKIVKAGTVSYTISQQ